MRQLAISARCAACHAEGLQLLDETVAIHRLSLRRDGNGSCTSIVSTTLNAATPGNDRASVASSLLGKRVLVINLNLKRTPNLQLLH